MKGNPHRILQKVVAGEIELFVSHEQFEELSRVLEYPKLKFTEEQKLGLKRLLSEKATFVQSTVALDIIKEDPTDNRILECAVVAKADFIISGDGHLLSLGKLGKTKITNATDFLRLMDLERRI